MKPYYTLYCCNCTEKGHDSSCCTKLRWSQHFFNPVYVTKYEILTTGVQEEEVGDDIILDQSNEVDFDNILDQSKEVDDIILDQSNDVDDDVTLEKPTQQNVLIVNENESTDKVDENMANIQILDCIPKEKYEKKLKKDKNTEAKQSTDKKIQDFKKGVIFCYRGCGFLEAFMTKQSVLKDVLKNVVTQAELMSSILTFEFQKFLKCLVGYCSAQVELRKSKHDVCLDICSNIAVKLIKCICIQYFERDNTEKQKLYYDCNITMAQIKQLFSMMKQSLAESTEDPLVLYDEINSGNLSGEELLECNKKLMIALYKFGSIDVHLGRDSFLNFQLYLNGVQSSVPFITCFGLIFLYNSIFVAHSIKNLPALIECYKKCKIQKDSIKESKRLGARNARPIQKQCPQKTSAINFEPEKPVNSSALPNQKQIGKKKRKQLKLKKSAIPDETVPENAIKNSEQPKWNQSAVLNNIVPENPNKISKKKRKQLKLNKSAILGPSVSGNPIKTFDQQNLNKSAVSENQKNASTLR